MQVDEFNSKYNEVLMKAAQDAIDAIPYADSVEGSPVGETMANLVVSLTDVVDLLAEAWKIINAPR